MLIQFPVVSAQGEGRGELLSQVTDAEMETTRLLGLTKPCPPIHVHMTGWPSRVLMCRNINNLCIFILHPATLLNLFISSSNFSVDASGFSTFPSPLAAFYFFLLPNFPG